MKKKLFEIFSFAIVLFGLAVQFYVCYLNKNIDTTVVAFMRYITFFTVVSNIFVCIYFFRRTIRLKSVPGARILINAYILLTGISYYTNFMVKIKISKVSLLSSVILHFVSPILLTAYNMKIREDAKSRRIIYGIGNVILVVYFTISMYISESIRMYPYWFMNYKNCGVGETVKFAAILLVVFNVILTILLKICKEKKE